MTPAFCELMKLEKELVLLEAQRFEEDEEDEDEDEVEAAWHAATGAEVS